MQKRYTVTLVEVIEIPTTTEMHTGGFLVLLLLEGGFVVLVLLLEASWFFMVLLLLLEASWFFMVLLLLDASSFMVVFITGSRILDSFIINVRLHRR